MVHRLSVWNVNQVDALVSEKDLPHACFSNSPLEELEMPSRGDWIKWPQRPSIFLNDSPKGQFGSHANAETA